MAKKYHLISDPSLVEEQLYKNYLRTVIGSRDGTIKNYENDQKETMANILDKDITPAKYPIFGYKKGKLNTEAQKTTSIGLHLTKKGEYCFILDDNKTVKNSAGEDHSIDYSKMLEGVTFDSSTDTKPEWDKGEK